MDPLHAGGSSGFNAPQEPRFLHLFDKAAVGLLQSRAYSVIHAMSMGSNLQAPTPHASFAISVFPSPSHASMAAEAPPVIMDRPSSVDETSVSRPLHSQSYSFHPGNPPCHTHGAHTGTQVSSLSFQGGWGVGLLPSGAKVAGGGGLLPSGAHLGTPVVVLGSNPQALPHAGFTVSVFPSLSYPAMAAGDSPLIMDPPPSHECR